MTPSCTIARRVMPSYAGRDLPAPWRRHVSRCLRCQAESATYRSMVRDLAGLRDVQFAAPPSIAPAVGAALSGKQQRPAPRPQWRIAAALAGAAVALAGFLTFIVRHRAHPVA